MSSIEKGTIASISDKVARVIPSNASGKPTAQINIPWHLRGDSGNLQKGTEVVFVVFDDATGLLLGRMDGEWGEYIQTLKVDNISASEDVSASNISLKSHVHGGVESGGSTTSSPS